MDVLGENQILVNEQVEERQEDKIIVNHYTIKEVASLLSLSATTIHTLERRNLLKRVENPNYKQEGIRYPKEQVDKLFEEQKKLGLYGLSVNELAKQFGVYPAKIKKAFDSLNMEVERVRTSLTSNRLNYVLTSEQEKTLLTYFSTETEIRPKRNHFYQAHIDAALYQLFIVGENQSVRLVQNTTMQLGFQLESGEFILYKKALRTMPVAPCYAIHQTLKKEGIKSITLELPVGTIAFYQVLDLLYSVCGIENFHVGILKGRALFGVRNGDYQSAKIITSEEIKSLQTSVVSGEVNVNKNLLSFAPTTKVFEVKVKNELIEVLRKQAASKGMKLNDYLQQIIQEKAYKMNK